MKKETTKVFEQIEKAQAVTSVFAILKDGDLCGRLVTRNSAKTGTTHVAFIIYPLVNNNEEIASYERVTGWGFNRQDFGIHYVLKKVQEKLKISLGVDLTGNPMFNDRWIQDFQRAGLLVIQAL